MEIVHIAAELAPIAKVGGLADVLHGLARALLQKKHSVQVILPKYDNLDLQWVKQLKVIQTNLSVPFDGQSISNTIWQGTVDEIPVTFIESHDPLEFFDRGTVYGCKDDIARFTYFCKVATEVLKRLSADVIHLHDWHTALMAGLVKDSLPAKVIFTIHNLAYQGHCSSEDLDKVGWKSALLKEQEGYNLLKGGIAFADHVTTVSPNYAQELLTTEMGGNLQTFLKKHQSKFSGILNGIDYTYWNPETDPFLPFHYSAHKPQKKTAMKQELRRRLSLADNAAPLACAITRLVPQKGPELLKAALLHTLERGGQFVLLGSALDENTHTQFYTLKRKLAGSEQAHLELSFNEELSHLVYAAADLFLIPSLFEPCGLTQQIAMRYGSVPLVRSTGGLVDTVFEGKNGFCFDPPTTEAINATLDRAFELWNDNPKQWQKLKEAGMQEDYSWDRPALEYLEIYQNQPTAAKARN